MRVRVRVIVGLGFRLGSGSGLANPNPNQVAQAQGGEDLLADCRRSVELWDPAAPLLREAVLRPLLLVRVRVRLRGA